MDYIIKIFKNQHIFLTFACNIIEIYIFIYVFFFKKRQFSLEFGYFYTFYGRKKIFCGKTDF